VDLGLFVPSHYTDELFGLNVHTINNNNNNNNNNNDDDNI
jgi:hypothetical protein